VVSNGIRFVPNSVKIRKLVQKMKMDIQRQSGYLITILSFYRKVKQKYTRKVKKVKIKVKVVSVLT